MSVPWYCHHVAFRELVFKFRIEVKSPLRVGSGRAKTPTSPVDLQVITVRHGGVDTPYIPGSSLKGVFRSASEYVARSLNIQGVCQAGLDCDRRYHDMLESAVKSGSVERVASVLGRYCLLCKLYGSPSYISHISFLDAYPPEPGMVARGVKTGVAIDRRSGRARSRALYTVEYVEPGSVFEGSIIFRNVPNYGLGLFSTVLRLVNSGLVRIGGFKSRGFGVVSMNPVDVWGVVYRDGRATDVSRLDSLEPLDEYDTEIAVGSSAMELLENSIVAWDRYVERSR